MFLPDKHISFAESFLGLSTFVLENIEKPATIDELWKSFEKQQGHEYPAFHSFDNLVLAVDILYALKAVMLNSRGQLVRIKAADQQCA